MKEVTTVDRRRFVVTAGGALAAAGAAAVVDAPHVIAQPKVQWRLSTTWTPALDVLQGAAVPGAAHRLVPRLRRRLPAIRGPVTR
jgi:TRAP-type mannitol/chloroaromatic compound transport system substrate-binding protein